MSSAVANFYWDRYAGVKGGERLAKLNELIRIEEANASMRICPWKGPGR